jgi:hypothetical protein
MTFSQDADTAIGMTCDVLTAANLNTTAGGEIAVAAAQVFAQRMALGAAAIADPVNADHAELLKIIPEKVTAFSEVSMILWERSARIVQHMSDVAIQEWATAVDAATTMAAPADPGALAEAQSRYAMTWVNRAATQIMGLTLLTMQAQYAAMAPVLRATTENAKRLKS